MPLFADPPRTETPDALVAQVERGDFDAHLGEGKAPVQVLHFGNTDRLTPEVVRLIQALHRRGFRVEGKLYDRAALDERVEVLSEAGGELVAATADADSAPVPRRTLGQRLKSFGGRLRRGLSLISFPFRPSDELKGVRARALLAGNTLLGLRLLAQGDCFNGLPTVALSAWIFGYMSNAAEIYRFKSQGASVRVRSDGTIAVEASQPFVAATTFLEELAITALLRTTVGMPVVDDPLGVVGDSILTAFAKTATEAPIVELYAQADKAKREGDDEAATALRRRAERLQDVFYNLMFPVLKFLQLPVPTSDPIVQTVTAVTRTISNAVLLAIGAYGVVREVQKRRASRPAADASCATLLFFEGDEATAEHSESERSAVRI